LLNPAFWLLAALIALRSGPVIAAAFVAFIAVARLLPRGRPTPFVIFPGWGLITNNLRQLFTLLDTWLALAIGLGAGLWRTRPSPPAATPQGASTCRNNAGASPAAAYSGASCKAPPASRSHSSPPSRSTPRRSGGPPASGIGVQKPVSPHPAPNGMFCGARFS